MKRIRSSNIFILVSGLNLVLTWDWGILPLFECNFDMYSAFIFLRLHNRDPMSLLPPTDQLPRLLFDLSRSR